jgi:hypothetical protein
MRRIMLRRIYELVIGASSCPWDGAYTEPDNNRQNVSGTAYEPLLDRLFSAQAAAFLAPTLEA